jgi:hypothetical protein
MMEKEGRPEKPSDCELMRNITITVNHEGYHPNIFSPPGHGILTKKFALFACKTVEPSLTHP